MIHFGGVLLLSALALSFASILSFNSPAHPVISDGVTDSAAGIQLGIDAIDQAGGVLEFPCGDFLVNETLVLSRKSLAFLRGQGFCTVIAPGPELKSKPVFLVSEDWNPTIMDMQILGNADSPTYASIKVFVPEHFIMTSSMFRAIHLKLGITDVGGIEPGTLHGMVWDHAGPDGTCSVTSENCNNDQAYINVACPANLVPVEMRQTVMRGALNGAREEAFAGADRESAAAD